MITTIWIFKFSASIYTVVDLYNCDFTGSTNYECYYIVILLYLYIYSFHLYEDVRVYIYVQLYLRISVVEYLRYLVTEPLCCAVSATNQQVYIVLKSGIMQYLVMQRHWWRYWFSVTALWLIDYSWSNHGMVWIICNDWTIHGDSDGGLRCPLASSNFTDNC